MKKWIFSLLSLAVFSPLQAQQEYKAPENTRFRIIGYAPSYRNLDAIPDRSLAQLDIACYAFATIDSTGIPPGTRRKTPAPFCTQGAPGGG